MDAKARAERLYRLLEAVRPQCCGSIQGDLAEKVIQATGKILTAAQICSDLNQSVALQVCFAALAVRQAVAKGQPLNPTDPDRLKETLERAGLPCFKIFHAVAGCWPKGCLGRADDYYESLVTDPYEQAYLFRQLVQTTNALVRARRPQSVQAIANDARLAAIAATYLGRSAYSDDSVRQQARTLLQTRLVPALSAPEADLLIEHLTLNRLRTLPDEELYTAGRNFALWFPLVRALCTDVSHPQLERLLTVLKEKLVNKYGTLVKIGSAEDAVDDTLQGALLALMENPRRYRYEASLVTWLAKVVKNQLFQLAKEQKRQAALLCIPAEPATGPSDLSMAEQAGFPAPDSSVNFAAFVEEMRDRYWLAESFFQPHVRPRVRFVWQQLLNGSAESDAQLAERWTRSTGERSAPNTFATLRRRLRQWLDVLRFVHDQGASGQAPDDHRVIDYIRSRHGQRGKDMPASDTRTIRHLAALARATQGDGSVRWTLLARYHIDNRLEAQDFQDRVLPMLRCHSTYATRLAHVNHWLTHYQGRLIKVRSAAQAQGLGFLVSSCWLLTVAFAVPVEDAVEILNLSAQESTLVRAIADGLQASG